MSFTESLAPERYQPGRAAATAYVIVGLRCDAPLTSSRRYAIGEASEIVLGRGDGSARAERDGERLCLHLPIDDGSVSTRHARLTATASGRWVLEDLGSKNGSAIGGVLVTAPVEIEPGTVFELGRTFVALIEGPPAAQVPADLPVGLRTMDPTLEQALARAAKHLAADAAVLVCGDSGVGKERVAGGLHQLLGRPGDLVAVNCGALPSTLVESELFGHRRGAFSGATSDRVGFVQAADRGTLFLDEVGDLPLPAQAALLRVLQEREVTPIGATRPVAVDLRVISATHRDLGAMVGAGQFRADLLARLIGSVVTVPPLRARPADLGLLVGSILSELAPDRVATVRLRRDAARSLYDRTWPANVRELSAVLRGALALCGDDPIGTEHLSPPTTAVATAAVASPDAVAPLDDRRREELVRLLDEHRGNVAAVARALQRHRSAIFRWMREYGLDAEHFRR
jgi:DNA-binding NtrC family response regulator